MNPETIQKILFEAQSIDETAQMVREFVEEETTSTDRRFDDLVSWILSNKNPEDFSSEDKKITEADIKRVEACAIQALSLRTEKDFDNLERSFYKCFNRELTDSLERVDGVGITKLLEKLLHFALSKANEANNEEKIGGLITLESLRWFGKPSLGTRLADRLESGMPSTSELRADFLYEDFRNFFSGQKWFDAVHRIKTMFREKPESSSFETAALVIFISHIFFSGDESYFEMMSSLQIDRSFIVISSIVSHAESERVSSFHYAVLLLVLMEFSIGSKFQIASYALQDQWQNESLGIEEASPMKMSPVYKDLGEAFTNESSENNWGESREGEIQMGSHNKMVENFKEPWETELVSFRFAIMEVQWIEMAIDSLLIAPENKRVTLARVLLLRTLCALAESNTVNLFILGQSRVPRQLCQILLVVQSDQRELAMLTSVIVPVLRMNTSYENLRFMLRAFDPKSIMAIIFGEKFMKNQARPKIELVLKQSHCISLIVEAIGSNEELLRQYQSNLAGILLQSIDESIYKSKFSVFSQIHDQPKISQEANNRTQAQSQSDTVLYLTSENSGVAIEAGIVLPQSFSIVLRVLPTGRPLMSKSFSDIKGPGGFKNKPNRGVSFATKGNWNSKNLAVIGNYFKKNANNSDFRHNRMTIRTRAASAERAVAAECTLLTMINEASSHLMEVSVVPANAILVVRLISMKGKTEHTVTKKSFHLVNPKSMKSPINEMDWNTFLFVYKEGDLSIEINRRPLVPLQATKFSEVFSFFKNGFVRYVTLGCFLENWDLFKERKKPSFSRCFQGLISEFSICTGVLDSSTLGPSVNRQDSSLLSLNIFSLRSRKENSGIFNYGATNEGLALPFRACQFVLRNIVQKTKWSKHSSALPYWYQGAFALPSTKFKKVFLSLNVPMVTIYILKIFVDRCDLSQLAGLLHQKEKPKANLKCCEEFQDLPDLVHNRLLKILGVMKEAFSIKKGGALYWASFFPQFGFLIETYTAKFGVSQEVIIGLEEIVSAVDHSETRADFFSSVFRTPEAWIIDKSPSALAWAIDTMSMIIEAHKKDHMFINNLVFRHYYIEKLMLCIHLYCDLSYAKEQVQSQKDKICKSFDLVSFLSSTSETNFASFFSEKICNMIGILLSNSTSELSASELSDAKAYIGELHQNLFYHFLLINDFNVLRSLVRVIKEVISNSATFLKIRTNEADAQHMIRGLRSKMLLVPSLVQDFGKIIVDLQAKIPSATCHFAEGLGQTLAIQLPNSFYQHMVQFLSSNFTQVSDTRIVHGTLLVFYVYSNLPEDLRVQVLGFIANLCQSNKHHGSKSHFAETQSQNGGGLIDILQLFKMAVSLAAWEIRSDVGTHSKSLAFSVLEGLIYNSIGANGSSLSCEVILNKLGALFFVAGRPETNQSFLNFILETLCQVFQELLNQIERLNAAEDEHEKTKAPKGFNYLLFNFSQRKITLNGQGSPFKSFEKFQKVHFAIGKREVTLTNIGSLLLAMICSIELVSRVQNYQLGQKEKELRDDLAQKVLLCIIKLDILFATIPFLGKQEQEINSDSFPAKSLKTEFLVPNGGVLRAVSELLFWFLSKETISPSLSVLLIETLRKLRDVHSENYSEETRKANLTFGATSAFGTAPSPEFPQKTPKSFEYFQQTENHSDLFGDCFFFKTYLLKRCIQSLLKVKQTQRKTDEYFSRKKNLEEEKNTEKDTTQALTMTIVLILKQYGKLYTAQLKKVKLQRKEHYRSSSRRLTSAKLTSSNRGSVSFMNMPPDILTIKREVPSRRDSTFSNKVSGSHPIDPSSDQQKSPLNENRSPVGRSRFAPAQKVSAFNPESKSDEIEGSQRASDQPIETREININLMNDSGGSPAFDSPDSKSHRERSFPSIRAFNSISKSDSNYQISTDEMVLSLSVKTWKKDYDEVSLIKVQTNAMSSSNSQFPFGRSEEREHGIDILKSGISSKGVEVARVEEDSIDEGLMAFEDLLKSVKNNFDSENLNRVSQIICSKERSEKLWKRNILLRIQSKESHLVKLMKILSRFSAASSLEFTGSLPEFMDQDPIVAIFGTCNLAFIKEEKALSNEIATFSSLVQNAIAEQFSFKATMFHQLQEQLEKLAKEEKSFGYWSLDNLGKTSPLAFQKEPEDTHEVLRMRTDKLGRRLFFKKVPRRKLMDYFPKENSQSKNLFQHYCPEETATSPERKANGELEAHFQTLGLIASEPVSPSDQKGEGFSKYPWSSESLEENQRNYSSAKKIALPSVHYGHIYTTIKKIYETKGSSFSRHGSALGDIQSSFLLTQSPNAPKNSEITNSMSQSSRKREASVECGLFRVFNEDDSARYKQIMALYKGFCQRINLKGAVNCSIELNKESLTFTSKGLIGGIESEPDDRAHDDLRDLEVFKQIPLANIQMVLVKRCFLMNQAVEIYTYQNRSYFLNLLSEKRVNTFLSSLQAVMSISSSRKPLSLTNPLPFTGAFGGNGKKVIITASDRLDEFKRRKFTRDWVKRKISTFEYLFHINEFAARSQHNIYQYPVFPWIKLDFENEFTGFRDFEKPLGVQTEQGVKNAEKQLESTEHHYYESVYSSFAKVHFMLLRVEPFTSMHLSFQGCLDERNFERKTFQDFASNNLHPQSLAELVPEFFYLADVLKKNNSEFINSLKGGSNLTSLKVPEWAKGSPEYFMLRHRMALESDEVSEQLPAWIDLVFGCAQEGPLAKEKMNVFPEYCYKSSLEGVDPSDPMYMLNNKRAYMSGCCPAQLFKEKHPKREKVEKDEDKRMRAIAMRKEKWTLRRKMSKFSINKFHVAKDNVVVITQENRVLSIKKEYFDKLYYFETDIKESMVKEKPIFFGKLVHNYLNGKGQYEIFERGNETFFIVGGYINFGFKLFSETAMIKEIIFHEVSSFS